MRRGGDGVRRLAAAGPLGALVLVLALIVRAASAAGAAGPWWFTDDYTSRAFIDPARTTAAVDTAGAGTVSLPLAPAALALDPHRAVGLIATSAGIQAWAFDGVGMARAPQLDLAGTGYVGAAWIGRAGNQLAAATSSSVCLAAWSGTGWRRVGAARVAGATGVAEGVPGLGSAASLLVGTASGFDVLEYTAGALTLDRGAGVNDLSGARGLASAPGGALVAVWHGDSVSVFGWDGHAYRETPTWEIPSGSQTVSAVAWFRDGNGYWVLTAAGALTAYGFDGSFVERIPALSTTLTLPVAALGTGWRQGSVAALVPTGWRYEDGSPLGGDPARSVTGLRLGLYASSAQLQSPVLAVGHDVDEMQVDATLARPVPGTSIAYAVSTNGGETWTAATPCLNPAAPFTQCAVDNTPVPPGRAVVYRLTLATSDPARTPVVDATQLFEIATEVEATSGARAILIR